MAQQQRMIGRGGKTPASTGHRANIDISGMAGAASGGGMADSAGPTASDAGGDFSGVGPEEGYNSGNKGLLIDPKGGMPSSFNPYHASGWQNLLSHGQAGMQANQLNNAVLLQQMQNQGQMGVEQLRGSNQLANTSLVGANDQKNIVTTGEQARQTAGLQQILSLASAHGVTPDQLDALKPALLQGAQSQVANNNEKLSQQGRALVDPKFNYYGNQGAGQAAEAYFPVAKNLALSPKANMGEVVHENPSFGNTSLLLGPTPGGTTNTSIHSIDPKTMSTMDTQTTTPSYNSGGLRPQIPIIQANNSTGGAGNFSSNDIPQNPFMNLMQQMGKGGGGGGGGDTTVPIPAGQQAPANQPLNPKPNPVNSYPSSMIGAGGTGMEGAGQNQAVMNLLQWLTTRPSQ